LAPVGFNWVVRGGGGRGEGGPRLLGCSGGEVGGGVWRVLCRGGAYCGFAFLVSLDWEFGGGGCLGGFQFFVGSWGFGAGFALW